MVIIFIFFEISHIIVSTIFVLFLVLEFATIIKDLVGGRSKIQQVAAVEDDPQRRKPDITRAKTYLNWEPKVPLKVGLKKTIDFFKKELDRTSHSQRNIFVPEKT